MMDKIDLIIDALEDSLKDYATDQYGWGYRPCCGADLICGHTDGCKSKKALAAARELKALKPVAIRNPINGIIEIQWGASESVPLGAKLYALEVTK
jgi:hypothetical protein